jgi:hypothetical protein
MFLKHMKRVGDISLQSKPSEEQTRHISFQKKALGISNVQLVESMLAGEHALVGTTRQRRFVLCGVRIQVRFS